MDWAARRIVDAESVLRVQRSAGNAAVAVLLATERGPSPHAHGDVSGHGSQKPARSAETKDVAGERRQAPRDEQRGSRATGVVQRDVGVEFQAGNVISQKKGKKKFGRTETKRKPLKKVGDLSMEVDTGSVMEFGTGHYLVWSSLKKDLDAVMDIISDIQALPKEPLDPTKPVNAGNPEVFRGFKSDHGKVDVTAKPAGFHGKPQTNEEIALTGFESLLKENKPSAAAGVKAKATSLMAGKAASANLTAFLQVIVFHLQMLQRDEPDLVITDDGSVRQPKAFMALLNKTDYTAMFQSLTASEQKDFASLVNADPSPIAAAAGTSMKDDLFKVGYWGWHPDRSKMRVLIKEGKIVRIQKRIPGVEGEGENKDIHTCGDLGVPARYCKTSRPIERVTVGAWLKSMVKPSRRTKKSVSAPLPTYAGGKGRGFSWGLSKMNSPGAFLFEVRNQASIPIARWPDVAEDRFNIAANCRPGSKLTYDGSKPKPPACP